MASTSYDTNGTGQERLLPAQAIIYAILIIGTGFVLWPVISTGWQQRNVPVNERRNLAQATQTSIRSNPSGALASEVQAATERWKKQGFVWTLQAAPTAMYNEILPVDMLGLETADLSGYRKAAVENWKGVESLPTLAGAYRRSRIAASAWPRPGSAAIELVPAMATDPDRPAKPWRVVMLFGSLNDATTYARQAVADAGSDTQETLTLGRAAQSLLAVPMDRQTVEGQMTYYCICPTQSTIQVSGVKLIQAVQQAGSPTDPTSRRYEAWKDAYTTFVAVIRERDRMATTPEQRQQIKTDVLSWKAANPEPPRPPGHETSQSTMGTASE